MRRSIRALLGLVVVGGAFLASSVWAPTAEAATWDCQIFIPDSSLHSDAFIVIGIINLSSDDREFTVRARDQDGDVIDTNTHDLNPGEGATNVFTDEDIYRISVTAGTDKVGISATEFLSNGTTLLATRDVPCAKR